MLLLLASALSVTVPPPVATYPSEALSPAAYLELVDRYRRGDFHESATALSEIPPDGTRDASAEYLGQSLTDDQRKAAILLHTEAAFLARREEVFHLEMARAHIERLDRIATRPAFERQWLLLLGHYFLKSFRYEDGRLLLKSAVSAFPEDAEIRLAFASAYETLGWSGDDAMLSRAEKELRRILETNPAHSESRLRLGRILQLRGRESDAIRELERCSDLPNQDAVRAVANILLGNIYARQSALAGAIRRYRAAAEIDPRCQVAAVALSHTLHRAGDRAGSREAMARYFAAASAAISTQPDVWWRFVHWDVYGFDALLEALREDVRR